MQTQLEKIKKLKELITKVDTIKFDKNRIVKEQKYEEAAKLRNEERDAYKEIDRISELYKADWVGDAKTSRRVTEDFYDVLRHIHDDDTNLTPALLRKKSQELKEASDKEGLVIKRQMELEKELKQRSFWIKITQYRPLFSEITDNRILKRSEELLVLHSTEGGGQEVCIAKYVEELPGIHDVKYYFENQKGERIVLNDVKGWQYMPGFEGSCRPIK